MAGISKKKIKTKGGKEVYKYTITYRDVFGKQHTSGLYDTLKEAKKDLNGFENVNPDLKNITYGAIFKEFLDYVLENYAATTFDSYNRYYFKFFKCVDEIKYDKIDSLMWQNRINEITKEQSPYVATICYKLAKSAMSFAKKYKRIDYNVFDNVEKPQLPKADINHLTIDEIKLVLDECNRSYPQFYTLLYTFIGTGAREGEILALRKSDIDFTNKSIKIDKQYTMNELKPKTKTKCSNRVVYIFDELLELLKEHVTRLKDNDLLFSNSRGKPINPSNLRNRFWKPLLKLCGIEKRVRLHDLRGSYIDTALSNGLSIKFAQNQVGHSKSSTTLDIYARNNKDAIENATSTLNGIFGKCEKNVRKIEEPSNKKIIQFPKKVTGQRF